MYVRECESVTIIYSSTKQQASTQPMIQTDDVTITAAQRAELKRSLASGLRNGDTVETLHRKAVTILEHPPLLVQVQLSGFSSYIDETYPETTASFPSDDVDESIEIEVSPA